jgi:glycosyltransferase involved in cell wall biosynthesis
MRLLLLDQFSDLGGAQQVLLEMLPAIRERGWQALVGLPGEGELFERIRNLGFEAQRIDCGPYGSGKKSARDLARFAMGSPKLAQQIRSMAQGVDVVYVNGPRLLPAAAMSRLRAPVLFHAHSYLAPGVIQRLTGMSLRRLNAWVVGSCRFASDPWREYVAAGRFSVIYNGVMGPTAPRRSGGRPAIGCVGRIAPEKGQREFVAAASIIHRVLPDCRFVVYGAALFSDAGAVRYEAEVRADAAGLPVEFAGWTTDVYEALANLDLLLVPSAAHEATTRVILEAFAAGVPVIAFGVGGIPEVVEHGVDGLLAGSVDEMARMVVELLGETARYAAMCEAARRAWRLRFTLEGYHRQILERIVNIAGLGCS